MVALRLMAEKGEPYMFVDGRGYVYGNWCITAINEVRELFHENGSPRKIEFSISLQKYGEDKEESLFGDLF